MTVQQLTTLTLQVSILLTVFTFGLRAGIGDVLYVLRRPSLLIRSLVAMFVIMPLVGVAIGQAFDLTRSVEIVLVALAVSPVPPLLPGKEQKAGGDASYGLGLMAIVGLLSIVTVPLGARVASWAFGYSLAMSAGTIGKLVMISTILPLALGLLVHARLPGVADRIVKPVSRLGNVLLAVGLVVILIAVMPAILTLIGNGTLLAMVTFVLIGLAVGHLLGGPNAQERPVLALSAATRHPAIALAIAKANFPDEPNLAPTVLLFLLVAAAIGVPYVRTQAKATVASASGGS